MSFTTYSISCTNLILKLTCLKQLIFERVVVAVVVVVVVVVLLRRPF